MQPCALLQHLYLNRRLVVLKFSACPRSWVPDHPGGHKGFSSPLRTRAK
jgi:hypothetical protein